MYSIYVRPPKADLLGQGDILDPEPLRATLKGHQDYFAEQSHFYRYIVLTQTCDLVQPRDTAEFICLAVIRRLSDTIGRRQVDARGQTEELLRQLFNHGYNRRGLFYLPANADHGIEVDSVVDLRVMFSLHKASYPDLLGARLSAIRDLYAAQLGHMIGHMFNRVAMPAWEELNPTGNLAKHVKQIVDTFEECEKQKFSDLLAQADRKTCAYCDRKPTTYRWVPVEQLDDRWGYKPRLLCSEHLQQYEQDRAGRPLTS